MDSTGDHVSLVVLAECEETQMGNIILRECNLRSRDVRGDGNCGPCSGMLGSLRMGGLPAKIAVFNDECAAAAYELRKDPHDHMCKEADKMWEGGREGH